MLPLNPWEHQNAVKALYAECVGEVCQVHALTRMDLDILLFLANNPRYDTATDIVEVRYLSKSQVSVSLKGLERRGYVRREYTEGNKKTAHLRLCPPAQAAVADGQAAQERFLGILLQGFSPQERQAMEDFNRRIRKNIHCFFREDG